MSVKQIKDKSTYDKTVTELMKLRQDVDSLKTHLDIADRVVAEFSGKFDIEAHCGYYYSSLRGALIHIHQVEHLKHIVPILKTLRGLGYKCYRVEDYAELERRTYNCGYIKVSVFLKSGASCKFEVVGEKKVPVLKLKCK